MKTRALTYEELLKLDDKGIDLLEGKNVNNIKTVKLVFSMVFPDKKDQEKLKKLPGDKMLAVFSEIIQKTFGATKEEKENL